MEHLLPRCPVCGGTQAFFEGQAGDASIYIPLGFLNGVRLGALICLTCGHTELRPHPNDMERLRAEVEKRGVIPQ